MAIVKKMGFGYKKPRRQRIISERPEIIAWRERYLRRIREIRQADPERAIVYTDETWLDQGHRTKKEWVDLETLKETNIRSLLISSWFRIRIHGFRFGFAVSYSQVEYETGKFKSDYLVFY